MKAGTNLIVGFVGMTHLGLNSAAATAEKGFSVVGFDPNPALIQNLKQHELPVIEPQLKETLLKNKDRITFANTDDHKSIQRCDIIYISADVQTNDQGESDLSDIHWLIDNVVPHLNDQAILVILCQVPPGFTRALSHVFSLERVYYQVETLIFGRAMERALYPERFIVGCLRPELAIESRYLSLLQAFACPILPMRYESAELAKISINCCLVASIGVANTLSEICEHIGADWSEIVPALKLDKRIGPHAYLAPGLGIAGGNLERDLATVLKLSQKYGTETGIVSAWIKNSVFRRDWVLRILHQEVLSKVDQDIIICILGLTYKENTHSIKNSPALSLLESLQKFTVQTFDPAIQIEDTDYIFNPAIVLSANSMLDAIKDADCLIIMTPWPEFRNLSLKDLSNLMKGKVIIDPYKVLKDLSWENSGFLYFSLGTQKIC